MGGDLEEMSNSLEVGDSWEKQPGSTSYALIINQDTAEKEAHHEYMQDASGPSIRTDGMGYRGSGGKLVGPLKEEFEATRMISFNNDRSI